MSVLNVVTAGGQNIIGQNILEGLFMVYDFENQRVGLPIQRSTMMQAFISQVLGRLDRQSQPVLTATQLHWLKQ